MCLQGFRLCCPIFRVGRAQLCLRLRFQPHRSGPLAGRGALLSTPLDLIFPDDALLSLHLALDPVLKHVACLRKLPDYLIVSFSFALFTEIERKVQGLPDGKFVRCHVLLQSVISVPPKRRHAVVNERYSVWRLTAEVFPCCPRSSS